MRTYHVTLTGESPLLMHADDLKWRGTLDRWLADPEHRKAAKAGDDRTPAWKWIGYCYHDGQVLGIPSDNLMTMLREGGAQVPTGKKGGTFKRQSQSGLVVNQMLWPIQTPSGTIPWGDVAALVNEPDYTAHESAVAKMGFELFAKGAKVGASKHIRVRPRFDTWSASGTIAVFDERISGPILASILEMAGMYCGLGDWRPSSPGKPGPWGRFRAELREAK